MAGNDQANLYEVARMLQLRRPQCAHRRFAVVRNPRDAVAVLSGRPSERLVSGCVARRRTVAFMFPGVGDQRDGMARELYDKVLVFRSAFEECARTVERVLQLDIESAILGKAGERLKSALLGHAAIFAMNYSLSQLLMACGIEPAAVIGHSLGEYAAAAIAGMIDVQDMLRVVCERARLMEAAPEGAMLSVALGAADLGPLLPGSLDIAVVNSAMASVVAGSRDDVARFAEDLLARGIACLPLPTNRPVHSRRLCPLIRSLDEIAAGLVWRRPRIPVVSNLTGTWLSDRDAVDPTYWGRHMCSTVQFEQGIRCLLDCEDWVLLEVGPGGSLASFVKQNAAQQPDRLPLIGALLGRTDPACSDLATVWAALGRLWISGVEVDWHRARAHLCASFEEG